MVEIDLPQILPIAEVPKKAGFYKGKPVEQWTWKDFQNYFDDLYKQKLDKTPPTYKPGTRKAQIEYSYNLRGKELLKAMMDWLIKNPYYSPNWDSVGISLCLGNHYWSAIIAEKAKKMIGKDLDNPVDEL